MTYGSIISGDHAGVFGQVPEYLSDNDAVRFLGDNINELKEEGIIEEVESDIYTGGRKPKIIRLVLRNKYPVSIKLCASDFPAKIRKIMGV